MHECMVGKYNDCKVIYDRLKACGLLVSISGGQIVRSNELLMKLLEWLNNLCKISDASARLCCHAWNRLVPGDTVSTTLLDIIVRHNCYLNVSQTKALHALFLTLLTDVVFRKHLAIALVKEYEAMSTLYAMGIGPEEQSITNLSVQVLTVPSLVNYVIHHCDALAVFVHSIYNIIKLASTSGVLDLNHRAVKYRRYNRYKKVLSFLVSYIANKYPVYLVRCGI